MPKVNWLQGGTWKLTRGSLSKFLIGLLFITKSYLRWYHSVCSEFTFLLINTPHTHTSFEAGVKVHCAHLKLLVHALHDPLATIKLWMAFPSWWLFMPSLCILSSLRTLSERPRALSQRLENQKDSRRKC